MHIKFITAFETAAFAFTAGRLILLGLTPRQPALLAFLFLQTLVGASLLLFQQSSHLYFWAYVVLTPLAGPVSLMAVRESLGLVLHQYPGIRTVARRTMYAAVGVALLASYIITAAFWQTGTRSNLYYIEVINRSVTFALAVVVTSLLLFLSHYRLQLSRNRLVSSVAFGCLVLAEAVTLFVDSNSIRLVSPVADMINTGFATICVGVWGVMLRTESMSEARPPREPRQSDEYRLEQLRALDQLVSRASRL